MRRLLFLLLALAILPSAALATAPTVGTPTPSANSASQYTVIDFSVPVTTQSQYPYLPYTTPEPSYAANLKSDEDPQNGVSLDGLFLPPGQSNWANAVVQPGFYGVVNGVAGWHVRFAPTAVGSGWQMEARVTDAGGSVTSSPVAFICTAGASHGYVKVSPTDSRYFEFTDGTPFVAAGLNDVPSPASPTSTYLTPINSAASAGATTLSRVWLMSNAGLDVIGGYEDNNIGPQFQYGLGVSDAYSHSGRFSLSESVGGGFTGGVVQMSLFAIPTTATARLTGWVLVKGTGAISTGDTAHGFCFNLGSETSTGNAHTVVNDDGSWHYVDWTITPSQGNWRTDLGTTQLNATFIGTNNSGTVYLSDWTAAYSSAPGVDQFNGNGYFRWLTHYNQSAAQQLDTIVQTCQSDSPQQYLMLNCMEEHDAEWMRAAANGSTGSVATTNADGGTTDLGQGTFANASLLAAGSDPATAMSTDTFGRRIMANWVRYVMARWGPYTSVAMMEEANEVGGLTDAVNDGYAMAIGEYFGRQAHLYTAEHRVLTSTSFPDNKGGDSWVYQFFENLSSYPDIDYGEMHWYAGLTNSNAADFVINGVNYWPTAVPYDGGYYNFGLPGRSLNASTRYTSGGVNGEGYDEISVPTPDGQGQSAHYSNPIIGSLPAGTYTLSTWVRSSVVSKGPYNSAYAAYQLNGGSKLGQIQVTQNYSTWTNLTSTFTLTSGQGIHGNLYFAGPDTGGTGVIDFSDTTITLQGSSTPAQRITWDEPYLAPFNAAYTGLYSGAAWTYVRTGHESWDGSPVLNMPLVIGEQDYQSGVGVPAIPTGAALAPYLASYYWADAFSAAGGLGLWWTYTEIAITTANLWGLAANAQAVINSLPIGHKISSGNWRNARVVIAPVGSPAYRPFAADASQTDDTYTLICVFPRALPVDSGSVVVPNQTPNHAFLFYRFSGMGGKPYPPRACTSGSDGTVLVGNLVGTNVGQGFVGELVKQ